MFPEIDQFKSEKPKAVLPLINKPFCAALILQLLTVLKLFAPSAAAPRVVPLPEIIPPNVVPAPLPVIKVFLIVLRVALFAAETLAIQITVAVLLALVLLIVKF